MTTENQIKPVVTWGPDTNPSVPTDTEGRLRVMRRRDGFTAAQYGWLDPAEAAVQWDGLPRRMTVRFDLDVLEADLKEVVNATDDGIVVRCLSLIEAYRKSQEHAVDDEPLYDRTPGEPVPAGDDAVDIVFAKVLTEGPPRYEFVEVEDAANGMSVNIGEWVTLADANGFARLRIPLSTCSERHVRDVANPVTDWAWTGRPMDRAYARWVLDDAESNTVPALLEAARVCGVDARPFVLRSVAFDIYEGRPSTEDADWEQARQYVTGLVDRSRRAAPIGVEARCTRCGETCNPTGPDDVTHLQREDGTDCGGRLQTVGEWHSQPTVLRVDATGAVVSRIDVKDGDVIVVRALSELNAAEVELMSATLGHWEAATAERLGVNVKTLLVHGATAEPADAAHLSSPLWQDEHDLLHHVYKVHGFGGDLTGASLRVIDDAHRRCHRDRLWTWCDPHGHLGDPMPDRLPIDCTGYLLDPDDRHTTVHVEHDGPCPVHTLYEHKGDTRTDGDVTVTTRADSASGTRAPWRDGTEVAGEQRSGREGTDLVEDDRIGRNEPPVASLGWDPPVMPLPVMGSVAWDAHLRDAHGVTTSSNEALLVLAEVHRVEHRDGKPMRFPHCHAPDVPELVQVNAREHGTAIPDPLCTGALVQTARSQPGRLAEYELRHDRTCPVHKRAVFGEVSIGAVVTVVVRDGRVTDVRIMPDQGRSSMHPLPGTGHDALLDVVDGTTWAPLENLPDGLHWDV